MRRSKIMTSLLAVTTIAMSTAALAQPRDYRGYDGRPDMRDHRGPPVEMRHGPPREMRYGPPPRMVMRDRGPGGGPGHGWYRGDRLPREYRDRYYVVNDWRGHRLAGPPRGYQWVQSGADYLLIAIATGIIAQVVLGR